jgi:diguanylate cyclase (GGDEF)-like protein
VAVLADEAALALDHERLIRRLEDLAETDQLTGLTNRRGWDLKLPVLLSQARRSGRPLTVAIADLDRFKRYNDLHGHPEGDRLLRRTARAFAAGLRPGDLLARWGGEEFVLALPDCAAAEALGALERLRLGMPDEQTCSVGYAVWDGTEPLESLVERADVALYDAKQAGRDRVRGEAPALA